MVQEFAWGRAGRNFEHHWGNSRHRQILRATSSALDLKQKEQPAEHGPDDQGCDFILGVKGFSFLIFSAARFVSSRKESPLAHFGSTVITVLHVLALTSVR